MFKIHLDDYDYLTVIEHLHPRGHQWAMRSWSNVLNLQLYQAKKADSARGLQPFAALQLDVTLGVCVVQGGCGGRTSGQKIASALRSIAVR